MTGAEALQIAREAGADAAEAALVVAIGRLESGLGDGWSRKSPTRPAEYWTGQGAGSNNWGGMQAGASWNGPTFQEWDKHPDGTYYLARFRAYPSPAAGAADLLRRLRAQWPGAIEAARRGDWYDVSRALYVGRGTEEQPVGGYYEGHTRSASRNIENHFKQLSRALVGLVDAIAESRESSRSNGGGLGVFALIVGAVGVYAWQRKRRAKLR